MAELTQGQVAQLASLATSVEFIVAAQTRHAEMLSRSLQSLAVVESQQVLILKSLDAGSTRMRGLDERLGEVETHMPGLKEVRRWVVAAVLGIASAVGLAGVQLTLSRSAQAKAVPQQTKEAPK